MNSKSNGYDNLGWESPKDLAKAHGSKMGRGYLRKGNGLRISKRMRWAKEAQKQWNGSKKSKII